MKNYQYVLDIETPFIRKLYDKEDNYKVELLTPYGILEELKKLQEENADLETKLAESDENIKLLEQDRVVICNTMDMYREKVEQLKQRLAEWEIDGNATLNEYRAIKYENKQLNKALELACEELYDSDSISICAYCPYDIQDECADECPQNTKVLEKYFKTKAKEMMKSE